MEGVAADREKRKGGCIDNESLSGGTAVEWRGDMSGEAKVEEGLDEEVVDVVDAENGAVDSLARYPRDSS